MTSALSHQLGEKSQTLPFSVRDLRHDPPASSALEFLPLSLSLALDIRFSYLAGFNGNGQLGFGDTTTRTTFTRLTGNTVNVCASDHTLITSVSNAIYTWGKNDESQVGNGGTADRLSPSLRASCCGDAVGCGFAHCLLTTSSGNVFSWGLGTADIDECTTSVDNCDIGGATCTNTAGTFTCACNSGYSGDGLTCTNVDECTTSADNCNANAGCTDTTGSFTCACNLGFTGDGVSCTEAEGRGETKKGYVMERLLRTVEQRLPKKSVCFPADIDECTTSVDNCDIGGATCTNTAGTFTCACNSGYSGDGLTCTGKPLETLPIEDFLRFRLAFDIDECTTSVDDCNADAACSNSAGSFTCTCSTGFSGNGVACSPIDQCTLGTHNCDANGACTDASHSFTCACNTGYSGDGVTCTTEDQCTLGTHNCDANGACTDASHSFTCACNTGYSGDGVTCTTEDQCALGTHNCDANGACTDASHSFTCACNTGYSGDGVTCTNIDECTTSVHDCHANATCTDSGGSFSCACTTGFSGTGVVCNDIDECTTSVDNCDTGGATCTNTAGTFTCACNSGYSGDGLTCTNVDECSLNIHNCDTSANCTDTTASFSCSCNDGYSGDGVACSADGAIGDAGGTDVTETLNKLGDGLAAVLGDTGTATVTSGQTSITVQNAPDGTTVLSASSPESELTLTMPDGSSPVVARQNGQVIGSGRIPVSTGSSRSSGGRSNVRLLQESAASGSSDGLEGVSVKELLEKTGAAGILSLLKLYPSDSSQAFMIQSLESLHRSELGISGGEWIRECVQMDMQNEEWTSAGCYGPKVESGGEKALCTCELRTLETTVMLAVRYIPPPKNTPVSVTSVSGTMTEEKGELDEKTAWLFISLSIILFLFLSGIGCARLIERKDLPPLEFDAPKTLWASFLRTIGLDPTAKRRTSFQPKNLKEMEREVNASFETSKISSKIDMDLLRKSVHFVRLKLYFSPRRVCAFQAAVAAAAAIRRQRLKRWKTFGWILGFPIPVFISRCWHRVTLREKTLGVLDLAYLRQAFQVKRQEEEMERASHALQTKPGQDQRGLWTKMDELLKSVNVELGVQFPVKNWDANAGQGRSVFRPRLNRWMTDGELSERRSRSSRRSIPASDNISSPSDSLRSSGSSDIHDRSPTAGAKGGFSPLRRGMRGNRGRDIEDEDTEDHYYDMPGTIRGGDSDFVSSSPSSNRSHSSPPNALPSPPSKSFKGTPSVRNFEGVGEKEGEEQDEEEDEEDTSPLVRDSSPHSPSKALRLAQNSLAVIRGKPKTSKISPQPEYESPSRSHRKGPSEDVPSDSSPRPVFLDTSGRVIEPKRIKKALQHAEKKILKEDEDEDALVKEVLGMLDQLEEDDGDDSRRSKAEETPMEHLMLFRSKLNRKANDPSSEKPTGDEAGTSVMTVERQQSDVRLRSRASAVSPKKKNARGHQLSRSLPPSRFFPMGLEESETPTSRSPSTPAALSTKRAVTITKTPTRFSDKKPLRVKGGGEGSRSETDSASSASSSLRAALHMIKKVRNNIRTQRDNIKPSKYRSLRLAAPMAIVAPLDVSRPGVVPLSNCLLRSHVILRLIHGRNGVSVFELPPLSDALVFSTRFFFSWCLLLALQSLVLLTETDENLMPFKPLTYTTAPESLSLPGRNDLETHFPPALLKAFIANLTGLLLVGVVLRSMATFLLGLAHAAILRLSLRNRGLEPLLNLVPGLFVFPQLSCLRERRRGYEPVQYVDSLTASNWVVPPLDPEDEPEEEEEAEEEEEEEEDTP
uniref:EGF-like domain-containing protein n=1 Tax=Chromera velia CCMP2878 TaxID=1169474 RepID=A0A0G4I9M8_9ALVE|eukprot:Cvel_12205.t1-p1 / transcript=Cvel_12205.t1 / gene=Cvel_12205 / organism=Chromera_velia_CCMP2878 / gene_product=Fibrillin-2, putative / transcript_product=Fibrillin-2, putative / location=Cvel_scaffold789:18533-33702(-) / protein_length=1774 / sequence_SO=supercontig / SO=protein_coding / is_pseudo=false